MPAIPTEIVALAKSNPTKAKQLIMRAFRKSNACRQDAAKALGVCVKTLSRTIENLRLEADLWALEEQSINEGWHHGRNRLGGRIPKPKISTKRVSRVSRDSSPMRARAASH